MTLGAILSGTDPIAVSGLLSSLGAPPRLQMHISGESLLNDGAAVLFYNIFSRWVSPDWHRSGYCYHASI